MISCCRPGLPVLALVKLLMYRHLVREKSVPWHAFQAAWVLLVGGYLFALCRPSVLPGFVALFSMGVVGWTVWRDRVAKELNSHLRMALAGHPVPMQGLQRLAGAWVLLPVVAATLGVICIAAFDMQHRPAQYLFTYAAVALFGATMVVSLSNKAAKERWAVVLVWLAALIVAGDNW